LFSAFCVFAPGPGYGADPYLHKTFNNETWMLIAGYRSWSGGTLDQKDTGLRSLFTTANAPGTTFSSVFTSVATDGKHYSNANTWSIPVRGYLLEGYASDGTSRNIQGIIYTASSHTWSQLGSTAITTNMLNAFSPTNALLFNASGSVAVNSYYVLASSATATPVSFTTDQGDFIMLGVSSSASGASDAVDTTFNGSANAVGIGVSDGAGSGYTVASDFSIRGSYTSPITTISASNKFGDSGAPHAGLTSTGWVMVWGLLTVPTITRQPISCAATQGTNVTLTVAASGSVPLFYQWQRDGAAIPNATSATYTAGSFSADAAGVYTAVVSNYAGSATSLAATLSVRTGACITKTFNGRTWMLISGFHAWPSATIAQSDAGIRGLFTVSQKPAETFSGLFTSVTNGQHYSNPETWDIPVNAYLLEGYNDDGTSRNIQGVLQTDSHTWSQLGTSTIGYNLAKAYHPANAQLFNASGSVSVGGYYVLTSSGTSASLPFSNDTGDFIMLGVTSASADVTGDSFDTTFNNGVNAVGIGISDGTGSGYTVRDSFSVRGNAMAITTISSGNVFGGTGTHSGKNTNGWVFVWGAAVDGTAPTILTNPVSQTVTSGVSVAFSVTASGTSPLTYQWKKDGSAIAGATSSSYSISSVGSASAGSYTVVVSNYYGTAASSAAILTVYVPPTVTANPSSLSVTNGGTATFSVTATGTAPLSYQWKKGGAAIDGATSSSYTISGVGSASAGSYSVTVSNAYGTATSGSATLTVLYPPTITSGPSGTTAAYGGTASFSVTATGTGTLYYQWKKNGTSVVGATSPSYTLSGVTLASEGSYSVTVSNAYGTAASGAATLTVSYPPTVTTHPLGQTLLGAGNTIYTTFYRSSSSYANVAGVAPYSNAVLCVAASGRTPLSYQWRFNGEAISGATNATLTIIGSPDRSGSYDAVVANADGSTASRAASVCVDQPAASFAYDFSSANWSSAHWGPKGTAVWANDTGTGYTAMPKRLRLTSSGSSQYGFVWYRPGAINPTQSWSFAWSVQLGCAGNSGADNLDFFLQTDGTNAVAYGPNNGTVSGLSGKFLCVHFDTYQNASDPSGSSLLIKYGSGSSQTSLAQVNLATAFSSSSYAFGYSVPSSSADVPFNVKVSYLAASNRLTVALANASLASGTVGSTNNPITRTYTLNLASVFSTNAATVGFSGMTGWAYEKHDVLAASGLFNYAPIRITSFPTNQTVLGGGSATFATAAVGAPPLAYQWLLNGAAVSGATNATYKLTGVTSAAAGSYSLAVSNLWQCTTGGVAVLTVLSPPLIAVQPISQSVLVGSNVTLSVVATGDSPLAYQWKKDGTALSGATSSGYSITSAATNHAGRYAVTVTNRYGSATSSSATLTVLRNAAVIVLSNLSQSYSGAACAVATETDPADLPVTLAYGGASAAPTAAGRYAVVAAVSTATYAGSATGTLVVAKLTPSVTAWPTAAALVYGQKLSSAALTGGAASVPGAFAFASPSAVPAVGTAEQSAVFTPTDATDYNAVTGTVSVTVNKASPSVTAWPTAAAITYGQALSASSLSGGSASVGGTFAFTSPGTVPGAGTYAASVTFTPSDTVRYSAAAGSVAVAVSKAYQSITLEPLVTNSIPLNQFTNPIPVVASASSGLDVTVALDEGSAASLVSNALVNIGQSGTVSIRLNQSGNENYYAADEVAASFDVTKINQTLVFAPVADQIATNPPVTLSASASSGLAASFAVLSGPATMAGDVLTLTGAGRVTVQASQPGNDAYNAAASTNRSFLVTAVTPVITWNELTPMTYGDSAVALTAVSSSGLTLAYRSSDESVATVSDGVLTVRGVGTCVITAVDAGNAFYLSAETSRTLTVTAGTPDVSSWPSATPLVHGEALATSSLSGGATSVAGSFSFTDPTKTPDIGTAGEGVVFTPTDTNNYQRVSGEIPVTVYPRGTFIHFNVQ
jgi:hypothetical protein